MSAVSPQLRTAGAPNPSLADWYAEHRPILGKIARAYAPAAVDAAELEQEMLYQLWRSLPRFAGEASRATWVYRVCLNTALTWRRAASRRAQPVEDEAQVGALVADEPSPAAEAERGDLVAGLYAALRQLSPGERALILPVLDGLTHREIGEIAGMTENHVAVTLLRIRRRLATLLKGVGDELG